MTREEAKEELIQSLTDNHIPDPEAVEMAIKALEPCEDAISRQVVIDAIDKWVKAEHILETLPTDKVTPLFKSVHKLLSVNPQPKTGHWIWCVGSHKCSNCEEYTCFSHKELLRYCPNCGAKMVDPQESEEV